MSAMLFRTVYWIPLLTFLAHIIEEYPRFPEWATRHFGATSRPWYVYSHIPLVILACALGGLAESAPPQTTWPMLATSAQWVLATNAGFHLATTVLFREYSPGVFTGTLLFLPGTVYLLQRTVQHDLLTTGQLAVAIGLGTAVGAGVIASLWLRMDFDWGMRRPAV